MHAEFWEATRRHELAIQRCDACSTSWHPPNEVSPCCSSAAYTWTPSSGTGTIHSFTVVHHVAHAIAREWVPYVVVLVDLDDSVRFVGTLRGVAAPRIGLRVRVEFEDYDELTLPVFVPADPEA